jgi:hypothetical protein
MGIVNKIMHKSPLIVAAVFLFVQVWGLADYSAVHLGGSIPRGWLFALALESGIFFAWYFTRQNVTVRKERKQKTMNQRKDKRARIAAFSTAILLLVISGYLNTAKSIADLPKIYTAWDYISALVMGIMPTMAASVLGYLQGNIDRLPYVAGKSAANPLQMRAYMLAEKTLTLIETRIDAAMQRKTRQDAKPMRSDAKIEKVKMYKCDYCHQSVKNKGGHESWCLKNPNRRKRKDTAK